MSRTIPYTHWAYFPDRAGAETCAAELADYVTRISEPDPDLTPQWLLLAARDVEIMRPSAAAPRGGGDRDPSRRRLQRWRGDVRVRAARDGPDDRSA